MEFDEIFCAAMLNRHPSDLLRSADRKSVGRGFEPHLPYSEAVLQDQARRVIVKGEVPASALGIQRFDGSLPSRPDNVQRFPD